MPRVILQFLYALAFGVISFILVWVLHEGVLMLSHDAYIREGDQWVDLQLRHVVPLAWKTFARTMIPIAALLGLLSSVWSGLVGLALAKFQSVLQPVCAFLFGAVGGLGLYTLATAKFYAPTGNPYPYLASSVLAMGAAAYAYSSLRMHKGWTPRLGDVALIAVAIAFSTGWSYLLLRVGE
jgi:hypothetical protein